MENIEIKDNKVVETLTKELESLSAEGLHEFFKFFYKMNHTQGCMISKEQFEEFLKMMSGKDDIFYGTNKEILLAK